MERFEPLKISFLLRTPMVMGWPYIHFDALIAHTLLREELGQEYYTLPSKKAEEFVVEILHKKMPIKRTIHNGYELWHASVSIIAENILGGVTIYKRFDSRHISLTKSKKKRIDIARGRFKAFAMRMPLVVTKKVIFYVCGDKEEIERLLRHIPALGKKRVYGFGDIKKYIVEEMAEDHSIIRDNVAMRPIPVGAFKKLSFGVREIKVAKVAYKPPYWWKQNVDVCVMPGSVLREYEL